MAFKKGYTPWNKGKKVDYSPMRGKKHSIEIIEKMRRAHKGKKHTEEAKRKISKAHLGMKLSDEIKKKISLSKTGCKGWNKGKPNIWAKGDKNVNWKGGITPINEKIRKSIESRLWREAVFARDNWTCQKTGQRGSKIVPHHIQNFADYPELRFAIDNGITLSLEAHIEFHRKYGVKNNNREQLEEFLSR